MNTTPSSPVRLFASSRSWIESEAIRQLYAAALLGGVDRAVGFPDLHPGRHTPVGAAYVTDGVIYPHFVGGDIGCGMALFTTGLPVEGAPLDLWSGTRFDLEHAWEGDVADALVEAGVAPTPFDDAFGTLGEGNHFAELQAVDTVFDLVAYRRLRLPKGELVALIHSGSRGVGDAVLRAYSAAHGVRAAAVGSPAAVDYLDGHDLAVAWARANRALIARRLLEALGGSGRCVWDGCHNSITRAGPTGGGRKGTRSAQQWIHRRGAVKIDGGPVIIPGSRGALSYLVQPLGDGHGNAWSLAHGAGRKWARSESRARMRERFRAAELAHTPLGGRVICGERDLLFEEAPGAYKNIDVVVQDLVEAGLVEVIATLRPLLTYKTRGRSRS
jgi:release factor H-coupled RctB family protein